MKGKSCESNPLKGKKIIKPNPTEEVAVKKDPFDNMSETDDLSDAESIEHDRIVYNPFISNDKSLGKFITESSPIPLKILSFLNHGDLQNCARVCKVWESLVETILRRRVSMEWFYAGSCLKDMSSMPERFAKFVKEIKVAPQLILGFEPNESKFSACEKCLKKKTDRRRKVKCQCVKQEFDDIYRTLPLAPAGCYRISSYGIISSYVGEFHTVYTNEDNDFNHTSLVFPTSDGLDISAVSFTKNDVNAMTDQKMLKILMEHKWAVKAILIYTTANNQRIYSVIRLITSILREKQKTPAVSIGGGVVKKIFNCSNPEASTNMVMFIFRGAKVSAYSTVLKSCDASDITRDIKTMTDKVKGFSGKKFCFMTECTSRQSLYISDEMDLCCNLESKCLNRYLPGVPVFGFWSYGEIGLTTHDENSEKDADILEEVLHSYCTSFLYLILEE